MTLNLAPVMTDDELGRPQSMPMIFSPFCHRSGFLSDPANQDPVRLTQRTLTFCKCSLRSS